MIPLTDKLWIGGAPSIRYARHVGVPAVFNVAVDLRPGQEMQSAVDLWPDVEYVQVGLIDGPGNDLAKYCAAVLTLACLLRKHKSVLVYDHDGGRALAVVMAYFALIAGQRRRHPTAWGYWPSWDESLADLKKQSGKNQLPEPHQAVKDAFGKLPFGVMGALL